MTFKWFLFVMAISSTAAWVAWLFVLNSIDPTQAGWLGFFLFYITLFIALSGTVVLFGTLIRIWTKPADLPYRQTRSAFRQGVILTCLFMCSLTLLSFELLRWWSILLLIALFSMLELLLVSRKKG